MPKTEDRLISKAVAERAFNHVRAAGIRPDMFFGERSREILAWSYDYLQRYDRSPSERVISTEFPGYKLRDDVTEEPLDYFIDRVRRDYLLHQTYEASDKVADALDAFDPQAALGHMAEAVRSAAVSPLKTVNVADKLAELKQTLMGRADHQGLIGIDTGFETINNATLGWQPSQLITIAGLGGAGKSTLLMLMARRAQAQGKRPYFMSFEMGEDEQLVRYMAMAINVPYNKLVAGRLTKEEWARYDRVMDQVYDQATFTLCTDIARSSTVPGLEVELRQRDLPDVAFIDGVYMMRDEQTKKSGADWQAMTNITRDLKQMAQRLEIPVVISTQALPGKTTKVRGSQRRRLDMYSAGYSSSFAQDSDVMFGLERDEAEPTQRILRVTKARHCAPYTVLIEWNWKTASFGDELEVLEGDDEDDDDEP